MAGSILSRSDDLIVLVGCCAALVICGLVLQLVHFIQHRKRPSPSEQKSLSEAKPTTSTLEPQVHRDTAA